MRTCVAWSSNAARNASILLVHPSTCNTIIPTPSNHHVRIHHHNVRHKLRHHRTCVHRTTAVAYCPGSPPILGHHLQLLQRGSRSSDSSSMGVIAQEQAPPMQVSTMRRMMGGADQRDCLISKDAREGSECSIRAAQHTSSSRRHVGGVSLAAFQISLL
jgi:hypothetical protein